MQYIDYRTVESIREALNGDISKSDFEGRDYPSDGDEPTIYSLDMEIKQLENYLFAMFNPEKDAMVFEYIWFNFATEAGPTSDEIRKELRVLEEVREEIRQIIDTSSYEFSKGVLNRENQNPTGRQPVFGTASRFSPSVLHEGEDMRMSIGISKGDEPF